MPSINPVTLTEAALAHQRDKEPEPEQQAKKVIPTHPRGIPSTTPVHQTSEEPKDGP